MFGSFLFFGFWFAWVDFYRVWGIPSPSPGIHLLSLYCLSWFRWMSTGYGAYRAPPLDSTSFLYIACLGFGGFLQGMGHTEPLPWNPPPFLILPFFFFVGFYRVWGILSPSPGTHLLSLYCPFFFGGFLQGMGHTEPLPWNPPFVSSRSAPSPSRFAAFLRTSGRGWGGCEQLSQVLFREPDGPLLPTLSFLMLMMIIGARDRSPATPVYSLVTMLCMLKQKKKRATTQYVLRNSRRLIN